MRKVLIVVNGAYTGYFHKKIFRFLETKFLSYFNGNKGGILKRDYKKFIDFIKPEYEKVIFLDWKGTVIPLDILEGERKFVEVLRKFKRNKIDVIAFSLGGVIVQNALLTNPSLKVNKILFSGAVFNVKKEILNCKKLINIYSDQDKMSHYANEGYNFSSPKEISWKKSQNILLQGIQHHSLCRNLKIPFENSKKFLFEFYSFLLGDIKENL